MTSRDADGSDRKVKDKRMAEEGQKWTEECQKMRQRLIKLSKEEICGDIFLVGFGNNQNKMQKNKPNTGKSCGRLGRG